MLVLSKCFTCVTNLGQNMGAFENNFEQYACYLLEHGECHVKMPITDSVLQDIIRMSNTYVLDFQKIDGDHVSVFSCSTYFVVVNLLTVNCGR